MCGWEVDEVERISIQISNFNYNKYHLYNFIPSSTTVGSLPLIRILS